MGFSQYEVKDSTEWINKLIVSSYKVDIRHLLLEDKINRTCLQVRFENKLDISINLGFSLRLFLPLKYKYTKTGVRTFYGNLYLSPYESNVVSLILKIE